MQSLSAQRAAEATHLFFAQLKEFGDSFFDLLGRGARLFEDSKKDREERNEPAILTERGLSAI